MKWVVIISMQVVYWSFFFHFVVWRNRVRIMRKFGYAPIPKIKPDVQEEIAKVIFNAGWGIKWDYRGAVDTSDMKDRARKQAAAAIEYCLLIPRDEP